MGFPITYDFLGKVVSRIAKSCLLAGCLAIMVLIQSGRAIAGEAAVAEFQRAAYAADFARGISNLQAMTTVDPADTEALFGTGALQFFNALANLQRGFYRHNSSTAASQLGPMRWLWGMRSRRRGAASGPRLLPVNPNATPMTYQALRGILARFVDDLAAAEKTLASVGDRPVKLPLQPFRLAIDLNDDGVIALSESLIGMLIGNRRLRPRGNDLTKMEETTLAFDTADASWLRGYANLLMASVNMLLAFDFERSYETAAHNLYGLAATKFGRLLDAQRDAVRTPEVIRQELDRVEDDMRRLVRPNFADIRRKQKVLRSQVRELGNTAETAEERQLLHDEIKRLRGLQTTYYREQRELRNEKRRLQRELAGELPGSEYSWVFDIAAYIHTMNWKVDEPLRLRAVRRQLLQVMRLNINTWRLVRAETDDDREWLPNAQQTPPFGRRRLTDKVIDSWLLTTALAEDVLEGRKLLPHPRFKKGVNLKKFFDTAQQVDFVLLVTGHALLPYLETGEIVDRKAWRAITNPMGRDFGLYAFWFN